MEGFIKINEETIINKNHIVSIECVHIEKFKQMIYIKTSTDVEFRIYECEPMFQKLKDIITNTN
jgi:hypothetical protein